jgi:hypothetical protein
MFVRPLAPGEREAVERGLRARDAVTLRRSQIVLASARGERAPAIARSLGCDDQTVRNVLHAFNAAGPASLQRGSSRPRTLHAAFDAAGQSGCRRCCTTARAPSDGPPACGRWSSRPRSPTSRGSRRRA